MGDLAQPLPVARHPPLRLPVLIHAPWQRRRGRIVRRHGVVRVVRRLGVGDSNSTIEFSHGDGLKLEILVERCIQASQGGWVGSA